MEQAQQARLFDQAPSQARDTSVAAARAIEPRMTKLQALVLASITKAGERGMTDKELQADTGLGGSTERPRRIELHQKGLVKDSGNRRDKSAVWVLA